MRIGSIPAAAPVADSRRRELTSRHLTAAAADGPGAGGPAQPPAAGREGAATDLAPADLHSRLLQGPCAREGRREGAATDLAPADLHSRLLQGPCAREGRREGAVRPDDGKHGTPLVSADDGRNRAVGAESAVSARRAVSSQQSAHGCSDCVSQHVDWALSIERTVRRLTAALVQ